MPEQSSSMIRTISVTYDWFNPNRTLDINNRKSSTFTLPVPSMSDALNSISGLNPRRLQLLLKAYIAF